MSQKTELSPLRKILVRYLTYVLIFTLVGIQPLVIWQVTVWSAEMFEQFSMSTLFMIIMTIAGDLYILWDVIFSNLKPDEDNNEL